MLAILATHPIQYQVPIWKALAARGRVPFEVLYLSRQGVADSHDPGFGRRLAWDIDLLGGYPSTFVGAQESGNPNSFWWLRLAPRFGERLRTMGATALWVQGWQVAAYWQAIFAARAAGVETWLRGETNLRSNAGRGLRGGAKRLLLGQFLRRVDHVLAIGRANRAFYLDRGVPPARIESAPYCVDNARFRAEAAAARGRRAALRAAWRIPEDAFCFLFAGKFQPKKHPLDLVGAAARLATSAAGRPVHLLFVGSGELGGALRAATSIVFDAEGTPGQASRNGAPASFAGFLNQSAMADAYAAADCLVLPSDAGETWGLVVNEAMASGLPAIVSDACGSAEDLVAPLRPDLVFPLGDIDRLARSLAAAVADPPPAEQLLSYIERYDCLRTVETVERLYAARVAAGAGRTPDLVRA